MKPIDVLTKAFTDGTTDEQLARLDEWGGPILCGPESKSHFILDGVP